LVLLASPLNWEILEALADGPQQQVDLRRACGMPAPTTLRAQLKKLGDIGAIEMHRRSQFPGALEYELTPAGRELLDVAAAMERWLANSPEGPLELGRPAAKAAIKALVEGWSTSMLRALAASELTLTELDSMIASINYPAIERRLAGMRLAGQVEARHGSGRGRPYGISDWGRQAIAPLIEAARWERRHQPATSPPIDKADVETAFLLTTPLLGLPYELSGSCRMAVDLSDSDRQRPAGVLIEAREGRVVSCNTELEGSADAWVSGPASAWLSAIIDGDPAGLEQGGNRTLSATLLAGLHGSLFGGQLQW
jgi:DNA-binding HxlR family transcriptional regulator